MHTPNTPTNYATTLGTRGNLSRNRKLALDTPRAAYCLNSKNGRVPSHPCTSYEYRCQGDRDWFNYSTVLWIRSPEPEMHLVVAHMNASDARSMHVWEDPLSGGRSVATKQLSCIPGEKNENKAAYTRAWTPSIGSTLLRSRGLMGLDSLLSKNQAARFAAVLWHHYVLSTCGCFIYGTVAVQVPK